MYVQYWRIFPSLSIDFSVNVLSSKALLNMIQTDILSPDVLSTRTFCPHGCFFSRMLCRRTFRPSGRFVRPDVLSVRTFFLPDVLSAGRFVSPDILSAGRLVPPDVLSRRTFCPWTFCLQTFCMGTIRMSQGQNVTADGSLDGRIVLVKVFPLTFGIS